MRFWGLLTLYTYGRMEKFERLLLHSGRRS